MQLARIMITFVLAGTLILTASCKRKPLARDTRQETDLITAFRTLSANQPDYMADITTVAIKDVTTQRIAKKAGMNRWEFSPAEGEDPALVNEANKHYRVAVITYPDQPWLGLDPQEKTYTELLDSLVPIAPDMQTIYENVMQAQGALKVIVENIGTETVDGHTVDKIRIATKADKPGQGIFFYVAKDLKNLLVKMEVTELHKNQPTPKGERMAIEYSNISLDVPDELFQVPKGYKKVDYDSFMSKIRERIMK